MALENDEEEVEYAESNDTAHNSPNGHPLASADADAVEENANTGFQDSCA